MTGNGLGWGGIARIGLVQAAIGSIVVLMTSTLNRVMVIELGLAAAIPGALVALHLSWDLGNDWTINSITSRRMLNYTDYVDIDATPVQLGDVLVDVDQDQTSQELQAVYSGDRLTLVGGVYYLREDVGSHQEAYANAFVIPYLGLTSFTRTIDDDLVTTSEAAYLNATYAITPRLNASVGVRYTSENKDYYRTTSTFYSNALFNSTFAFPHTLSQDWSDTSPMISVDYHFTDDLMVYARASRGFKAGGFNGRANTQSAVGPFGTETVDPHRIEKAISAVFDLRPGAIVRDLDLLRPIYAPTAAYGHFGRTDVDLPWERLDKVEDLKASV